MNALRVVRAGARARKSGVRDFKAWLILSQQIKFLRQLPDMASKLNCNKFVTNFAESGLNSMQSRGGGVVSAHRARAEQLLQ
jgi:hypothetical protein